MRLKVLFSAVLAAFFIASCVDKDSMEPEGETSVKFDPAIDKFELKHEFRAAWLTTVGGYDWPDGEYNIAAQKNSLVQMIRNIKLSGCNVVIFHTISNMDAMYRSGILPWSEDLTGTEGKDPGYDPLELAVKTAHDLGMEIHAWVNPLRLGAVKNKRADNSLVYTHPEWIREYDGNYFLDPALKAVHQHLGELATELFTKYDIDGLHIDDYFYPSGFKSDNKGWDDSKQYAESGTTLSKDEWRFANIDACVKALYTSTHAAKADAIFGVSPAGRLGNTRALYADPVHWINQNIIDYLAPQLYWTIERGDKAAFDYLLKDEWSPIMKNNIKLVIGLAAYRHGESTGIDKAFADINQFARQVALCRANGNVAGHVWFRTKHIMSNSFQNLFRNDIYRYGSLVPTIGNVTDVTPSAPSIRQSGNKITWDKVDNAKGYAVYELAKTERSHVWSANMVHSGEDTKFNADPKKNYFVIAYNGKAKSVNSNIVYTE